jgi:hypothetical protein
MKNKKQHILSFILIAFLIVMSLSTSEKPPREITNHLTSEVAGGHLFIKVRTLGNPMDYVIYGNEFALFFEEMDQIQIFSKYTLPEKQSGQTVLVDKDRKVIEKIAEGEAVFETFAEGDFFVIKIKKELIKYDAYTIYGIFLYNRIKPAGELYLQ